MGNVKIDDIARVIEPDGMFEYERDFAFGLGPTVTQMQVYPRVKLAREKAAKILELLSGGVMEALYRTDGECEP